MFGLAYIYASRETVWPGIVEQLLDEGGPVASTLLACDTIVRAKIGWSIRSVLRPQQATAEFVSEPVLTAVQIALTAGWRERGTLPDVIGARCGGEFAAAYAAGRISMEDALELACRVSYLIHESSADCRTLALQGSIVEVAELQRLAPARLSMSADNPDRRIIVTCRACDLGTLQSFLADRGVANRLLSPRVAYHSPAIDWWGPHMRAALSGASGGRAMLPLYSSTAGGLLPPGRPSEDHFWRVVRQPSLAGPMLSAMIADGCRSFVEVGGHPSLTPMIQDEAFAAGADVRTYSSMEIGGSFAATASILHEMPIRYATAAAG